MDSRRSDTETYCSKFLSSESKETRTNLIKKRIINFASEEITIASYKLIYQEGTN